MSLNQSFISDYSELMLRIILLNFLDVINIICMFAGSVDAPFQHQPDESSSTETAPHSTITQRQSQTFSICAAKVRIKGKIMCIFFSTDSK